MDKRANYHQARKVIRLFCEDLSKIIPLEKAILFGSFAKGTAGPESDVDIVFLSHRFAGMDDLERAKLISKARNNYKFSFDYFGFTPEEYERASPLTTIGEIKETGQVVFSQSSSTSP